MIKIADLISEDRIACDVDISSKKRSLEVLSDMVGQADEALNPTTIFNKLISREKLGSTGLGRGVALPHARIEGSSQAYGALIRLRDGIDFDAFDHQPVDLLFALVVPEHFTDEHLQILARLAEMFSDATLCQQLRACPDPAAMLESIADWDTSSG